MGRRVQAKAQRESHLAGIAAARLDAKRALVDTETLKIKNKADSVLDTMHGRVEVAREALAVAQSMFNDVNVHISLSHVSCFFLDMFEKMTFFFFFFCSLPALSSLNLPPPRFQRLSCA
jgi:hypothetical protein